MQNRCAVPSCRTCYGAELEVGFNAKGKKTLAHRDYHLIRSMWHPTKNEGKLPADFLHKSNRKVWLQCSGCHHGCGRIHEWEARINNLARAIARNLKCPKCSGFGSFCPCRSIANHPILSKEWHHDNPLAIDVSMNSNLKYLWICRAGHSPYRASCDSRCCTNTGCPECGRVKPRTSRHPAMSDRPDLLKDWMHKRNERSPNEVPLGSNYTAWWDCSNREHAPWQARVYHRALSGSGCPDCRTKNRFKPRLFGPLSK
jgi:hypothetical protein